MQNVIIPLNLGKPDYTNKGYIKINNNKVKKYTIAELRYEHFWNEEFQYVLTPYWDKIDNYEKKYIDWVEIPSYDLSLRKPVYYRANHIPEFLTMRVPPKNREDIRELLNKLDMKEYDIMEYLIRTPMKACQDDLIMEREK